MDIINANQILNNKNLVFNNRTKNIDLKDSCKAESVLECYFIESNFSILEAVRLIVKKVQRKKNNILYSKEFRSRLLLLSTCKEILNSPNYYNIFEPVTILLSNMLDIDAVKIIVNSECLPEDLKKLSICQNNITLLNTLQNNPSDENIFFVKLCLSYFLGDDNSILRNVTEMIKKL